MFYSCCSEGPGIIVIAHPGQDVELLCAVTVNDLNYLVAAWLINVTEFAKTDLMGTNTEIHFLSVDESHTHALSRDTKHLRLDVQVCFFRRLFPML